MSMTHDYARFSCQDLDSPRRLPVLPAAHVKNRDIKKRLTPKEALS